MSFRINGRPTEALFFIGPAPVVVCVHQNGTVSQASVEDTLDLRSEDMELLSGDVRIMDALKAAQAFAAQQGWTLDTEFVYFD